MDTRLWLQDKGVIVYRDHASLLHYCSCRHYWAGLPTPFFVANHQRAAVDLLYRDFFVWHKEGRTVDMYGWIDTDELIRAIFDDFQIIVEDLLTRPAKINPATRREYQDWIWKMAA